MEPQVFEEPHMGTRVVFRAYAPGGPELRRMVRDAFAVFAAYESRFSGFRQDSELSRLNARAGEDVLVSVIFNEMIGVALDAAAVSGWAFDPLVGARTLPRNPGGPARPADPREVRYDRGARKVRIPVGSALDLNAVVKGAAIDEAIGILAAAGPVLVEAGGDIRVAGLPPGKSRWDIGVRDPRHPKEVITVLPLRSGAVCTSGDYFRGRLAAREGREHLVGPSQEAGSLTVVAPTAREADILSTAACVMPLPDSLEYVERQPGAAALAIDRLGSVFMSPRMRETFAVSANV